MCIIYQILFLSIGNITIYLDCHQHLFAVLFFPLLCPSYLDKAIVCSGSYTVWLNNLFPCNAGCKDYLLFYNK